MKNQNPTLHRLTVLAQLLALGWTVMVLSIHLLLDVDWAWEQFTLSLETFGRLGLTLLAFLALLGLMTWPFWSLLLFIRDLGRDPHDKYWVYLNLVFCAIYIAVACANLYALLVKKQDLDALELCAIQCAAASIVGVVYLLKVKIDN
jgi:hypothetical protein